MQNILNTRNLAHALVIAAATLCTASLVAQTPGTGSSAPVINGPDSEFVQHASEGGLAEVALSQLAVEKASSPAVRKFAQHMVQDHTENNLQLATIAAHENIAMSRLLSSEHSQLRDHLASLHDSAFDQAYVHAMREDHQKMDDLLKSSSAIVSTQELRTFINKTEPVVQAHLRMANELKAE